MKTHLYHRLIQAFSPPTVAATMICKNHPAAARVAVMAALAAVLMEPVLAFDSTPYPGPNPPDGTATYPWKIDLPADFDAIGTDGTHLSSQHYRITKDLDCGNQDHRIRANFTGTLDGGYHTVSRIRVDQPTTLYVGLVQNMFSGGVIRRVAVVDSYFRAHSVMGAIAGAMQWGSLVEECYSRGNMIISVSGNGQPAGGIVGGGSYEAPSAVVRNSFARDNTISSAFQTVGGISGYNDARVERCYSAGSTLTAPNYVGGVVGYGGSGRIVDSYSHFTNLPGVQVGSAGGVWQNALVPNRFTSNFDITQYSIVQLNWDPAIWITGTDAYPRLAGFNKPPLADAGADQTLECTGAITPAQLDGSFSSDPDGDSLTYEWTVADDSGAVIDDPSAIQPTGWFPTGTTMVTLIVSDGNGTFDTDDMLVVVHDTAAPVVACTTDVASLWPPDHRMVALRISLDVTDVCARPEQLTVVCQVSSSEADDAKGDGKSTGDVNGANGYISPVPVSLAYDPESGMFTGPVNLRAERNGGKNGRTYSISCVASDPSGNSGSASCVVVVPHDMGKK